MREPAAISFAIVSDHPPKALVISDGGLPALLAAAMEAERRISGGGGGGCLMPWPSRPDLAEAQVSAASSAARFLNLEPVHPVIATPQAAAAQPGAMGDSLALLAALHAARLAGCERVVWPIHHHHDDDSIGRDLDRLGAAIDRAQLIGRLGLLDGPDASPVRFETPLIDLTDGQLADLVVDLDAPVHLSWWWRPAGDARVETIAAEERAAWLSALAGAGWAEAGPTAQVAPAANLPRAAV
jgi:hypothetical protein